MDEFILIPKNTLDAYKISQDYMLTSEDVAKLMINKDLLKKFIELKAISIQFDIWAGLWKENTFVWLKLVEELKTIADEIGNTKDLYEQYEKSLIKEEKD
jgi:hypothetical protein